MQKPKIANIVAVANLGIEIDLLNLSNKITECEYKYNPNKFKAAILKTAKPNKSTCLLWGSGKLVSLGSKSLEECELFIKYFIDVLKNSGYPNVFYSGFFTENIVSSFDFGKEINLNEFRKLRYKNSFYEPEIFCGLNYKRGNRLTALLFWTGKVVITGAKNLEEIDEMYFHILPYLKLSKK